MEESREDLIQEIKQLKKRKKYGLVWEDKPEDVVELCEEKFPILTEIKTKEIRNDDNSPNILIEGDNYHALSVLNYTHNGKIDLIYIDPPYNTGNEFIFNDKIIDANSNFRHSKWISFMNKRLKIAKKLLVKNGLIFISIDDHEVSTLRLLLDEIFGQKNFVTMIIWKSRTSMQYSEPLISSQTEYILVYAKNKKLWNRDDGISTQKVVRETDEINYSNPDNDPLGNWISSGLTRNDGRKQYLLTTPSGKQYTEPWLYSEENMKKLHKENLLWYGINGDSKPRKKSYFSENTGRVSSNLLYDEFILSESGSKKKIFHIGTTESGTNELKKIFQNNGLFNYPKPSSLIKYIMKLHPNKKSIILDFFAGSGTTGHALLDLNKEDDGDRQFILCTNNENKICTRVCYPRIKKVINGYKNQKGEKIDGFGGNLKYFKTDFVDSTITDKNKQNIAMRSTEMLCLKESCFNEYKQSKHFTIFSNCLKYLAIIYDFDGLDPFIKFMIKFQKQIIVYQFTLDDDPVMDDFLDIKKFITLKPIPASIIASYRRIFK